MLKQTIIIMIQLLFVRQILSSNTTAYLTTMYATINDEFFSVLLDLVHAKRPYYNISENVYTWNITEVFEIVGDPSLLSKSILLLFPISIIQQLPDSVLINNDLNCLLDPNNTYYEASNCTSLSDNELCKPPILVATEHYPVYAGDKIGCGINCDYTSSIWGYSDEQQQNIYTTKIVVSSISMFMLLIMIINQGMDHRERKDHFCERPLIYQCVVFMTGFYVFLILQFLGIEAVGVNNILCQSDLANRRTVAFGAVDGGWLSCAVLGVTFYGCIILLAFYTALFSGALWRQFYAPLKLMYADLCNINIDCINQICFCNADMESDNFTQYSSSSRMESSMKSMSSSRKKKNRKKTESNIDSNNNNDDNNISRLNSFSYSSSQSQEGWKHYKKVKKEEWKISTFGQTYTGGIIVSCLCSKTLKFHLIVWFVTIGFCIGVIADNLIDAFHPVGICFTGGESKTKQFWFTLFPLLLSAAWVLCFLPSAILLIIKSASTTSSIGQKKTMQNLGCRLGCYFFGMTFSWVFIFIMALTFYAAKNELLAGVQDRVNCTIGLPCKKTFILTPVVFYLLFVGCFIAVLSALIMSCSQKHVQRWVGILPCLVTISGGIIQSDGTIQLAFLNKYLNDDKQTRSPRGSTMGSSGKNSSDGKGSKKHQNQNQNQHQERDIGPESTVTGTHHDHENEREHDISTIPKNAHSVELVIGNKSNP